MSASTISDELVPKLEAHRAELRRYCYRMLASPFEADDAVQETFIRAWRAFDRFEGRSSLRSWLYRIATNVCLDMARSTQRRARPMDLGPAREPVLGNLRELPETTWLEPLPDQLPGQPLGDSGSPADPAQQAVERESVRLAFVAALQHLPPRQRAALILCEVLQWQASEAAELLGTTVPSVNSALQRARATLQATRQATGQPTVQEPRPAPSVGTLTPDDEQLLSRYVRAFEAYDIKALTELIHEDATQSMPPYDLWLAGRDDIFAWWLGPGIGCRGSRVLPAGTANGSPAFAQYKQNSAGGHEPWAIQVLEVREGRIGEFTFFLDTARLFPLFGLPPRLDD